MAKTHSAPYRLSKDTYPKIIIDVHGTTVYNGVHGDKLYTPQGIKVMIDSELVDINDLVQCYQDNQR